MSQALRIFGDLNSGNCLKVLWTARHLGIPFEWTNVDVTLDRSDARGTLRLEFLALNPAGEVPLVLLPDGRPLAQSNAILRYLSRGTGLLPGDAYAQSKVDEWLFWEQYSHEPYLAVCRFQMRFLGVAPSEREAWRVARGERALDLMEGALTTTSFLASGGFSIADVALLPYTRTAPEAGFDLTRRPRVREWIERCEAELGLSPDQI